MNFNRKRMCANCPFRKKGAIELRPGRVESIVKGLLKNDRITFQCHKTTHGQTKEESACMGAAAYVYLRHGRTSVLTRLALLMKLITLGDIEACGKHLKD